MAYWAYCAALMEEMARAINRTAAADHYAQVRARIGAAFSDAFVHSDGTVGNGSQTSYVLALRFDLVPAKLRESAGTHLAAGIRQRGMKLSTGFLGTPYLLDVLSDTGQPKLRSRCCCRRLSLVGLYAGQRRHDDVGALEWRPGRRRHEFLQPLRIGAVVGFMYRRLAGIAPAAPGFRRIDINPISVRGSAPCGPATSLCRPHLD